jgi:outer membrane protein OmpA-like peptidoglycan-associated protein
MASATTSDDSASDDSLQLSVGVPIYFYFKLNTAQLVTKSQLANLTEIAKYAKEHHLTIHITGAADEATGTAKRNRALSIARARYIGKQFINLGIDKSQMKAVSLCGISQFSPKEANRFAMVVLTE